jgi:hypothetical protein
MARKYTRKHRKSKSQKSRKHRGGRRSTRKNNSFIDPHAFNIIY